MLFRIAKRQRELYNLELNRNIMIVCYPIVVVDVHCYLKTTITGTSYFHNFRYLKRMTIMAGYVMFNSIQVYVLDRIED